MSALSAERERPRRYFIREISVPLAASVETFRNACISWDASDVSAAPAGTGTDTDTFALGFALQNVDNSSGSKGDKNCIVDLFEPVECVELENDPGAGALDATDMLSIVYFLDDQTVTSTSTNNSKAGRFWGLTPEGRCRVEMLRPAP